MPVGLMVGAVGGTPSGFWLSDSAYRNDEACKTVVKKFAATYDLDKAKKDYEEKLVAWEKATEQAKRDGKNPPGKPQAPVAAGESTGKIGHLYESHIRPMQPFAIRGVLWDQGESGTAINGVDQFTLMGALMFHWADAVIDGDTVVVSSAAVPKPTAVRYAFSSKQPWANLFNKDGLPALPFRTDPEGK